MIRGRGPYAGPSKASPATTCQKCLKKDYYECKATAQERPYKTRPSRTQQLANPKLVPKLSSDVPNDLMRKDGIADAQLAKIEKERGRRRNSADLSSSPDGSGGRRRRRGSGSMSSGSVSTISTNARSTSPQRRMKLDEPFYSQQDSGCPSISPTRKRRRHSSTPSFSSSSGSSSDSSHSSALSYRRRRRKTSDSGAAAERNTRRRRSFLSPDARGRGSQRQRTRSRSRSTSMDRSQIARQRASMTPDVEGGRGREGKTGGGLDRRNGGYNGGEGGGGRGGGEARDRRDRRDREGGGEGAGSRSGRSRQVRPPPPPPPPPKRGEAANNNRPRSLSPFSKRLALTQAMNQGGGRGGR